MLIEFTVKNFASLKNETTLSAETGERLRKYKKTNTFQNEKVPILKNLLLFGPNGSGKSQLMNALELMKHIIVYPTQAVTDELRYNPFAFDTTSKKEDTLFRVVIELNKDIYEYQFEYNRREITSEKLIKNHKKIIFSRVNNNVQLSDDSLKGSISKLRENELFLYLAQAENNLDATRVFTWFAKDLLFVQSAKIPVEMLNLMKDEHLKNEMLSFLSFADFNIKDIVIRDVPIQSTEGMNKVAEMLDIKVPTTAPSLFTVHKVYEDNKVVGQQELNLSQESRGTQRLFYIVLSMMLAQIEGNQKTIIIDEFDDSLHYELASALIKLFNSTENLNQFIITTHDIQLLDANLRIDQIYLLDKDFQGVSELKSIFDFNDAKNKGRNDISFARRYISGQFGAIPIIDVDSLRQVLKMIHENYEEKDGKKE